MPRDWWTDLMSENRPPLPHPASQLEKLLTKLSLAMIGYTSLLQEVDRKVTTSLERLSLIERKVDAVTSIARASQGDTKLLTKDLSQLMELERMEQRSLEDVRRSLTDQQMRISESAHNLNEVRKDLTPIRGTPIHVPHLDEDEEERDPSAKRVIDAVVVLGKKARKYWKGLSLTTGTVIVHAAWDKLAVLAHTIGGWFGG